MSGKDYHFITTSHFQNLLHHENNSPSSSKSPTLPYFIEHAQFAGNWYGTSAEAVKNVLKNRHCVLDIERQGVERLKMLIMDKSSSKSLFRKGWNSQILTQIGGQSQQTTSNAPAPLFIFIAPPSLHSLKDRLLKRGSESPESLKQRLDASANDLHWGLTSRGTFDRVIVNDELESAYSQLISTLSEFNFI